MPATSPNWLHGDEIPWFTTDCPTFGRDALGKGYALRMDAKPDERCLAEDGARLWACGLPKNHDGKHLPVTFEFLRDEPGLLITPSKD
jgi:hypothetical protein